MTVFGHSVSFHREFMVRSHCVGEDSDEVARHIGLVLKSPSRRCPARGLWIDRDVWCKLVGGLGRPFWTVAGQPQTIDATRSRIGQRCYSIRKQTRNYSSRHLRKCRSYGIDKTQSCEFPDYSRAEKFITEPRPGVLKSESDDDN